MYGLYDITPFVSVYGHLENSVCHKRPFWLGFCSYLNHRNILFEGNSSNLYHVWHTCLEKVLGPTEVLSKNFVKTMWSNMTLVSHNCNVQSYGVFKVMKKRNCRQSLWMMHKIIIKSSIHVMWNKTMIYILRMSPVYL